MPRTIDYHGTLHTFPDDFTDQDVSDALSQYDAQKVAGIKARIPELQQQAQQAQSGWERQTIPQQLVQGAVRALPTIGGTIGTTIGGTLGAAAGTPGDLVVGPIGTAVGAMSGGARGAAIGGGLGRAAEEAIGPSVGLPNERAATPQGVAGDVASSMVGQSTMAKGPEAVALAAQPLARKFMSTALGSWGNRVAQAAQTALQKGIGPGFRWGKPIAQLDKLIAEGNEQSNALLRKAANNGMWHDPNQMVKGDAMRKLLSNDALTDDEISQIHRWNDEVLKGKALSPSGTPLANPKLQSPIAIDKIRQRYADEAKGKFVAAAEGEYRPAANDLRKEWAKAIASDTRSMLHDTSKHANAIPGFSQVERSISDLINLRDTLKPVARSQAKTALKTRAGAAALGAGAGYGLAAMGHQDYPHRLAAAGAGAALASPAGLSNMAIGMSRMPAVAPALERLLQGATALQEATATSPGKGQ